MCVCVGNACRTRVIGKLVRGFSSPAEAERHYFTPSSSSQLPVESANSGESHPTASTSNQAGSPLQADQNAHFQRSDQDPLAKASPPERMRIISVLFSECLQDQAVRIMPQDFLQLVVSCLNNFHDRKRSNVIYFLAKGIGTLRSDGSDTVFPLKRMPFGLVEYAANFFVAKSLQQVCSVSVCACVCVCKCAVYV